MKIISFEGIGGSGKSTMAGLLKDEFTRRGYKVLLLRIITRDRLEKALNVFSGTKEKVWVTKLPVVSPRSEAFSYLAFLVEDSEKYLSKPKYDLIILDRYVDTISTGIVARNNILGRRLDFNKFYRWFKNLAYKEILMPDKTVVLEVGISMAQQRSVIREGKKYTLKDMELFKNVSQYYKQLSQAELDRFIFIDASGNIASVLFDVTKVVEGLLGI